MPQAINNELLTIFQRDQNERKDHPPFGTPEYNQLQTRDAERRKRVKEIILAGEAQLAEDFYHAALVLHHGGDVEDVWQAYLLAQRATDMGYQPARWLTAATYDRWLMYRGKPQKYGTQIVPDGKRFRMWTVDPATTDAEREAWNVRPLHQQQTRARELTRLEPLPPMERAPDWLKKAIKRWDSID